MPPLLADLIHARGCKLKCEKFLTLPKMQLVKKANKASVYACLQIVFMLHQLTAKLHFACSATVTPGFAQKKNKACCFGGTPCFFNSRSDLGTGPIVKHGDSFCQHLLNSLNFIRAG